MAVVGLRTAPRPGWRTDIATALEFVRARPDVWLLGILGFGLRGGIILLTLPIVVLPTQVEARIALGTGLSSTGLTTGFWQGVAVTTSITVGVLLAVLYLLARVELGVFERLVADPASDDRRHGRTPRHLRGFARAGILARLFVVQSAGALVLLLAALPMAIALRDATMLEIIAPTSTASIYARIYGHVAHEIFLVILVVGLVELVTGATSRVLLTRAHGLSGEAGGTAFATLHAVIRSVLLQPLRTLGNTALGWALTVTGLIAGTWLTDVAWQATRSVFLADPRSDAVAQGTALLVVASLLALAYGGSLLALGYVSAVRASLSSLASLR